MPATATTADDIVHRYAEDIAYVAEGKPATTVEEFLAQLNTAVRNFDLAGVIGHEDLDAAGDLLSEALDSNETDRTAFLRRAAKRLRNLDDMASEYREMVGD